MWDMFKLILDKCVIKENEIDFTIIDSPVKSMSNHPLMLIARSGQENLLRHQVVVKLLHLKWRFVPRLAFYFNLTFYLFYMILFSLYTIELANFGSKYLNSQQSITEIIQIRNPQSNLLFFLLVVFLSVQIFRQLVQILLLDGVSYFCSSQNIIEIFTYVMSIISLLSSYYYIQAAYASIAVLFAFILFPLFIQKIRVFGLYVVAFR